jgi:hypothetical protein
MDIPQVQDKLRGEAMDLQHGSAFARVRVCRGHVSERWLGRARVGRLRMLCLYLTTALPSHDLSRDLPRPPLPRSAPA